MSEDAAAILGLLADDDRRRVFAALVLGAGTAKEVTAATGLDARRAGRALSRLAAGGLLDIEGGRYDVRTALFEAAARAGAGGDGARQQEELGLDTADPEAARVLRNFVKDGRLVSIPTARSKRLVVLDWLATRFEPGRVYPERDVNAELRTVHPDVAALRRYLVDEEFMERRDGFYWRAGGTFDV